VILIDTTVLVYAVGSGHALRSDLPTALGGARRGTHRACDHRRGAAGIHTCPARRRSRGDAVDLTRLFAEALTVIETAPEDLEHGLALFLAHGHLGAFDAVLAGVAIRRGAESLVSADRAFNAVPGLTYVDPAGRGLTELLRRGR
jgi:predicted nucleic acid-binding protein